MKENEEKEIVSDQSRFSFGVRDFEEAKGICSVDKDGQFGEAETSPTQRRDPEEARYNEAGQPIVTQGDFEMEELNHAK